MLRTVQATRYVKPLREGGSLPAIIEADDDGLYVLKFRGAGQGPKALIAEVLGGEIGRALGLPVPELVLVELDPALGPAEPDEEISDLLEASAGLNLGMDYLPGSLPWNPIAGASLDPALASSVVVFDAFSTNVDRTPRNPNLLFWHGQLRLIDHGAAFYLHHGWTASTDLRAEAADPFTFVKEHVLLPVASSLQAEGAKLSALLTPARLAEIVALLPDAWLDALAPFPTPEAHREAYVTYLTHRLSLSQVFVEEALRARAKR